MPAKSITNPNQKQPPETQLENPNMYYVICPACQAKAEIAADAVGPDRTWLWNVTYCETCGLSFDFDDEDVKVDDQPSQFV